MKNIFSLLLIIVSWASFSQSRLTQREVFDFNVGDEFQYEEFYVNGGFRNIILEKKVTTTGDSIEYVYQEDWYRFYSDYSLPPPYKVYTFSHCTLSDYQTNLDSTIDIVYQKQYKIDSCNVFVDSFLKSNKYNLPAYTYSYTKTCDFEGDRKIEEFAVGLGLTIFDYSDPGGPYRERHDLIYYKKGNKTYGNPDNNYTASIENPYRKERELKIYPNPVKSELNFSPLFNTNSSLSIYDCVGKCYFENLNISKNMAVSSLPTGIYFFKLENEGRVFTGKFMKD